MPTSKPVPSSETSATARARARWTEPASGARRPSDVPGTVLSTGPRDSPRELDPDAQLVGLMQEHDPHAFELVYDRHSAAALGLARRMVGDRSLAEDVTQEAFVSVWRSSANYRAERGSVRTWILGITRNRAIDALRRRTSQERVRLSAQAFAEPPGDPETTASAAVRRDEGRTVRAAIEGLPDEQRRAIELTYFAGLTQTEIAGELDLPLGTVKGRMRLALDKLRRALAPQEGAA